MVVSTPVTELLGIRHPVLLAGMNVAAGPKLAAAVSNAGGLGVIGGVGYTPRMLRKQIDRLKSFLDDASLPFGVDLLLPQVGGNARKTNKDYTDGKLEELIDIIIQSRAALFVSAVGVPPRWAVEKLHAAGILVMNMVGAPKHVPKALEAGVDLLCAQGSEGGGHTGDVPTSVLVPKVVDLVQGARSELHGGPVYVIAAGGIFDGRGLAMGLCMGAQAAWVGTRFVCSTEAGAPQKHQEAILKAGYHDTTRTIVFTGRPMRVLKNEYVMEWAEERAKEMKDLAGKGIIPAMHDYDRLKDDPNADMDKMLEYYPLLMGQVAGAINDIKPAKEIVEEMVLQCESILERCHRMIRPTSKL